MSGKNMFKYRMRNLKECLQAAIAAPANTTGMGNPGIDSGDIPVVLTGKPHRLHRAIRLKRKKHNSTKQKHA